MSIKIINSNNSQEIQSKINEEIDAGATLTNLSVSVLPSAVNALYVALMSYAGYVLSYDGNDNSSGENPTGGTYSKTVIKNEGNLLKTGAEFGGWNTKSDGTGDAIKAGDILTLSKDITLYAVWVEDE